MANITLAGTLRDPNGDLAVGDKVRFTHKSTTGETVKSASSILTIDPTGAYSVDLEYGLVLVEYKDARNAQFENLGVATVNGTNPATTIPELLNALVPVSSAELIEFQVILADCVAAKDAAEAAAATLDLINDLSQAYIFDTVALFKSSLIEFPDGKVIHLNDRNADFIKITGTGTANTFDIIASSSVNQSISVVDTDNAVAYGANSTDDIAPVIQHMNDTGKKDIFVDLDSCNLSTFEISDGLRSFKGKGRTIITSLGGHPRIIGAKTTRVRDHLMFGFEIAGKADATEDLGIDYTGFSYSKFDNVKVRRVYSSNWYCKGDITPTNNQVSNNTFIHCTGNNSIAGHGNAMTATAGQEANTANTFISCEFAGNAIDGVSLVEGAVNEFIGCTMQGNARYDILDNGQNNKWSAYIEGVAKGVLLDVDSRDSEMDLRSTFPLWNTFINKGKRNKYGLRGQNITKGLFDNALLTKWTGLSPANTAATASLVLTAQKDADAGLGFNMNANWSANFQSLTISLIGKKENFESKKVTLAVRYKNTTDITGVNLRAYAAFGATGNTTNGKFAVEPWTNHQDGYKTRYYDVEFPLDSSTGEPKIIFWLNYDGLAASNSVDIEYIYVADGVSTNADKVPATIFDSVTASGTTDITDINSTVNKGYKEVGRTFIDSSAGVPYMALGSADSAQWKNLISGALVVPA